MSDDIRKRALDLYRGPFRFDRAGGYIFDANDEMVSDNRPDAEANAPPGSLRVRGWGRIKYLPDPEALQDAAGELIAEALTAFWKQARNASPTSPPREAPCTCEDGEDNPACPRRAEPTREAPASDVGDCPKCKAPPGGEYTDGFEFTCGHCLTVLLPTFGHDKDGNGSWWFERVKRAGKRPPSETP